MKKKIISFALVAMSLANLSCQKEETLLQELKSQQLTYKYESRESIILESEMVENKTVTFTFDYDFFKDIVTDLDHKYFGMANGEDVYGRLENFKLKQLWINDFSLIDQEIFQEGEIFSTIFESAMLSFDFGYESRILAIQNSLTTENVYEEVVFNVQDLDLVDALELGALKLKLTMKENPTETRYFNYNFSIGCVVDGIYLKE